MGDRYYEWLLSSRQEGQSGTKNKHSDTRGSAPLASIKSQGKLNNTWLNDDNSDMFPAQAFSPVKKEIETDRTNPEYVGPGTWDSMHKDTFNCINPEDQKKCCDRIRDTCYTFNCKTCRGHCTEYINSNPPEDYIGVTWTDPNDSTVYQIGIAIWAWKFHNAVNARLGKKQMRWDACFQMYTTLPENCSGECGAAGQVSQIATSSWYPGVMSHR